MDERILTNLSEHSLATAIKANLYAYYCDFARFIRCLGIGLFISLGLELPYRYYLAYLNGRPVAASMSFLGAGVAGIYCVATVEEARGQGIGAAVTLAPLLEARGLGYHAGRLRSSDMGYNVYRRIGFQKVCSIDHYFLTI
jgi:GNAT superfamily N-acetyltransferase